MTGERSSPLDRIAETEKRIRAFDLRRWTPERGVAERDDKQAERYQRALDRAQIAYVWTIVGWRAVRIAAAAAAIGLALSGRVSVGDISALWR